MGKVTIVSGTNRQHSLTAQVADFYASLLEKRSCATQTLKLTNLPADFMATELYGNHSKHPECKELRAIMTTAQKYVFIIPEYNGSFPGAFKVFIDGLKYPETFTGKKCALVGLSKGPQGGAFAMSHLTDIFHHLGMHVHPCKPRLSHIKDSRLETVLANERYVQLLEKQAEAIMHY